MFVTSFIKVLQLVQMYYGDTDGHTRPKSVCLTVGPYPLTKKFASAGKVRSHCMQGCFPEDLAQFKICMYVCMYVSGVGQKIRPLHRDLQ
jgi:hypothetical protein